MTIKITSDDILKINEDVDDNSISDVKYFVIFLGHAHSGHSIIGSLLDSHPDIGIVNELNLPKLIKENNDIDRQTINKIVFKLSNSDKQKFWENTEYKYKVPGGCQGNTVKPLILGDKKGGGSTRIIRNNPGIFQQILKLYKNKLKVIHVIRNPYDNIAAYAHYWNETLNKKHVDRYFENMETVFDCKQYISEENWLTIDYKNFVTNPSSSIKSIFNFVDVSIRKVHLQNMVSIVKPCIRGKASNYKWEDSLVKIIEKKTNLFNLI